MTKRLERFRRAVRTTKRLPSENQRAAELRQARILAYKRLIERHGHQPVIRHAKAIAGVLNRAEAATLRDGWPTGHTVT